MHEFVLFGIKWSANNIQVLFNLQATESGSFPCCRVLSVLLTASTRVVGVYHHGKKRETGTKQLSSVQLLKSNDRTEVYLKELGVIVHEEEYQSFTL